MNYLDAEELADAVLGLTDEQVENAPYYDDLLYDKFGIDLETFAAVAEALIPFTLPARAAISGELFRGFVKDEAFIVKQPVG